MSTAPTAAPSRVGAPRGLPTPAQVMGRAGAENFTVASRLLPGPSRRHLLAWYGWARLVDQLGDALEGDRLAALDWVEAELDVALADPGAEVHPLVGAAAASVRQLGIDPAPLRHLVEANRMDQRVHDWRSFEDLLGYCRRSADPVGRLVLAAFGAATPQRVAWSDSICTGLQLVEHWQDVAEDRAAGRVYLPAEDRDRFGVTAADLDAPVASTAVRGLVCFEASRARRLLEGGVPLVASLRGRPRLAVAGFVAGGLATLDALAAGGFDPLREVPRPAPARVAAHTARLLAGRGAR